MATTTPSKFINQMKRLLQVIPVKDIPAQMLWGQPGVGKSASVQDLANQLNAEWKAKGEKKIAIVTDIRLVMYNPVDLRGIPTVMDGFAQWLKPKVLDLKETIIIDGEEYAVLNIFLMDEVSAASPSVQVCAYQIANDNQVGEHKLPQNTLVILAGNRVTDKSVAFEMSKALCNRLTHHFFECDLDEWFEWAYLHNINPYIIAFLHFKPELLNQFMIDGKVTKEMAFPTPRAWKNASVYMKGLTVQEALPLITGTVGEGASVEFNTFLRVAERLPRIEDIVNGTCTTVYREADINWSIVALITSNVTKYNQVGLTNVVKYINKMPAEFKIVAGKELLKVVVRYPDRAQFLLALPEWKEWNRTSGQITQFAD